MRKFSSQKFWSHGTSLGSLGPLSQGDVHPGFSQPQFLVIWGPYNYPGIVACLEQAENPKLTYSLVCLEISVPRSFGFYLTRLFEDALLKTRRVIVCSFCSSVLI